MAAPAFCAEPGCPERVAHGRCPKHRRRKPDTRPSASARGYDVKWRRTRGAYLFRHPLCECDECAQLPESERPKAEHVHHLDGKGPNGPNGHRWFNLLALSGPCHSRITAREQPGGFHRG